MYWLVIFIMSGGYGNSSAAITVMPEKYPDLAACQNAGMKIEPSIRFSCVPAPKSDKPQYCESFAPGSNMIICR